MCCRVVDTVNTDRRLKPTRSVEGEKDHHSLILDGNYFNSTENEPPAE